MDAQKYICEKCGGNHPTEEHNRLELGKLLDHNYLPSRQEIVDVIKLRDKDRESRRIAFEKYDELREIGHELLSKEFIQALGNYLESRIAQYKRNDQPITVLEVGAGNGRLGYFLQQQLNSKIPSQFKYFTTDFPYEEENTFGPALSPIDNVPVEKLDYHEALKQYDPTIVISSWMPYEQDWTADFRATLSVQEYILIGEPASTGHTWLTWANPDDERERLRNLETPYQESGFEAKYLEEVSKQQIDSPSYATTIRPVTYSFRRIPK